MFQWFRALAMFAVASGIFASAPAVADSLEDAVQHTLNPLTFDEMSLDEHSLVLLAVGGNEHVVYTRDQVIEWNARIRAGNGKRAIAGFKVLDKSEVGRFASIAYVFTSQLTVDKKQTETKITAHEIWERVPSGWRRLYSAQEGEAVRPRSPNH